MPSRPWAVRANSPAMESSDRKRVIEAALEINNGRVPVIAGTHHYSTRIAIELSKHAEKAGADGLLIVQPYYMAPTPTQAMDHYRRIAEAVSIPIVLYHNVRGTCVNFTTDHLVKLFEEKVIAGVKMSNPEPDRICQLLQATGGELTRLRGSGHCRLRRTVPRRGRLDLRNPQRRASCCQRTLYRDRH